MWHKPQRFKAKICFSLFSLLFTSVGQLIHLEACWDVRAGYGSIDQEVQLPFVCVFPHARACTLQIWLEHFITGHRDRQQWPLPLASFCYISPHFLPSIYSSHILSFSDTSVYLTVASSLNATQSFHPLIILLALFTLSLTSTLHQTHLTVFVFFCQKRDWFTALPLLVYLSFSVVTSSCQEWRLVGWRWRSMEGSLYRSQEPVEEEAPRRSGQWRQREGLASGKCEHGGKELQRDGTREGDELEQRSSSELSGETLRGSWTEDNKICHHLSVREAPSNEFLHITSPTHTGSVSCTAGSERKHQNTKWRQILLVQDH